MYSFTFLPFQNKTNLNYFAYFLPLGRIIFPYLSTSTKTTISILKTMSNFFTILPTLIIKAENGLPHHLAHKNEEMGLYL